VAFAYILITVIVALEVPLILNLQRRAVAEAEAQSLAQTQVFASAVGSEIERRGEGEAAERMQETVVGLVQETNVDIRVIVVDEEGVLIADSSGPERLGELYATEERPEIGEAANGDVPSTRIGFSETEGREILATAVPVFVRGEPRGGAVRITQGLEEVRANVRQTTLGLVAIGLAGLAAGLVIAFFSARSMSRPLSALATVARRLGRGDLSARTSGVHGPREVEEVGHAFDDMAARLEDTVRAQREFVSNASHQLRTPLTGMKLRLESAMSDPAFSPQVRHKLEAADREIDRLSETVDRLLVLARRVETGGDHRADVLEAGRRAVGRWEARARKAATGLKLAGEGGVASADSRDLDQILDNLIDNALSHGAGPIVVETGAHDGRVFIAVQDHGPGIPEDERARVLERFYRGRSAPVGGSGLGLAIVREMAERWSGSIAVRGADGGGTRVEVRLPAAATQATGVSDSNLEQGTS
jgi:two-component system, OmpR family, sensor kinase